MKEKEEKKMQMREREMRGSKNLAYKEMVKKARIMKENYGRACRSMKLEVFFVCAYARD